ncbi:hypothetical protein HDV04_005480 [Boothiomyces sp. JEL0838]|nr:hypothetical protein HDV04_005480 [Boothiomyces sp. JEL0838]
MPGRQDNAYVTPAAVILGMAVHELVGALYLLVSKYRTASATPIWLVAAITFVFLLCFITAQITVLDFITTPYPAPTWYFGVLILLNYLFNLCCTFGVGIMLLMRLRAFYRGNSVFQVAVFISLFVFSFKTLGDAYGIVNAKDIFNLEFLNYYDDPVYKSIPGFMAIGHTAEAIFEGFGSFSFFFALGEPGKSRKHTFYDLMVNRDGIRLALIIASNLVIAIFAIYNAINDFTYVTHTFICKFKLMTDLPSFTYAIQLYTFLKTSYVTAVDIIESQLNESKNSRKDSNRASIPRKSILRKPISQMGLQNTSQEELIQPTPPRTYNAQPVTSYISQQDDYVDYENNERQKEFVSLQRDSLYRAQQSARESVFVVRDSQDFSSMARDSPAFKRAQETTTKENVVSPTTLLSDFIDTVPSPAYF